MTVAQDINTLKHKLNSERMKGNIDFTDLQTEEKNGNIYVVARCTSPQSATIIRQVAKSDILPSVDMFEYDGIKNPATDYREVSFVAHNAKLE